MAYLDTYNAAGNADFQGRCLVAVWSAARDILAEDPVTLDHVSRLDWAHRVLREQANLTARQLAVLVLQNAIIGASPVTASDGDIQFQVNSIIPTLVKVG